MTLRATFIRLHRWAGLAAALILFILGVTGALEIVRDPIDVALNRRLRVITPTQGELTLGAMSDQLAKAYPGKHLLFYISAGRADRSDRRRDHRPPS